MISFLWPWAFAALPLPLIARWLMRPRQRQDAALRVPDVGRFDAAAITRGGRRRGGFLALLLAWLAWACLLGAAARPQFTGEPVSLPSSGRDLMLAIDISGSMNTEDMEVGGRVTNRLAAVKNVVTDFIARSDFDTRKVRGMRRVSMGTASVKECHDAAAPMSNIIVEEDQKERS